MTLLEIASSETPPVRPAMRRPIGGSPWTEDLLARVEAMWQAGRSASDIAEALGGIVTRNAVIGQAHRRRWSLHRRPARVRKAVPPKPSRPRKPRAERPAPAQRPVKAPPPRPRVEVPEPASLALPLLALGAGQCRYPDGARTDRAVTFCGNGAWLGTSWCEFHARLCYAAPLDRIAGREARAA